MKKFFINITELGNSIWYFLVSFFIFIVCFISEKINKGKFFTKIKRGSLLLFTSMLIAGSLTQIIKHIMGRPRPNYVENVSDFGFNFFSMDASYHSFPSGHTSTIFIVALFLSFLTPKIRYIYLFFAFIVAFSRVVVGAHYLSDVLGGIAIASIGFNLTFWLFNKFGCDKKILEELRLTKNLFILSLIVFLIAIIFLSVGSSLDIFFSGLFYKNNNVFVLQSFSYITVLARELFLPFLVLYILIMPILSIYLPIKKIYFNFNFNIKKILFLWGSLMFNVLIVINLLLKGFWGRARPNDITELGGNENFTAWFQISNACESNCSFVSGDASIGFSLIGLYFITNNKKFFWLALASGLGLGAVRILEGGHFLSDVIISGFLIFVLTYLQSIFYKKQFNNDL